MFVWLPPAIAARHIPGPVSARVIRVIDGDTILVMAEPWPLTFMEVRIRIAGIDTPEITGADCDAERLQGLSAKAMLARLLGVRDVDAPMIGVPLLTLRDIRPGKYQGRMVAEVINAAGDNVAEMLLTAGLAKKWDGSGARPGWC